MNMARMSKCAASEMRYFNRPYAMTILVLVTVVITLANAMFSVFEFFNAQSDAGKQILALSVALLSVVLVIIIVYNIFRHVRAATYGSVMVVTGLLYGILAASGFLLAATLWREKLNEQIEGGYAAFTGNVLQWSFLPALAVLLGYLILLYFPPRTIVPRGGKLILLNVLIPIIIPVVVLYFLRTEKLDLVQWGSVAVIAYCALMLYYAVRFLLKTVFMALLNRVPKKKRDEEAIYYAGSRFGKWKKLFSKKGTDEKPDKAKELALIDADADRADKDDSDAQEDTGRADRVKFRKKAAKEERKKHPQEEIGEPGTEPVSAVSAPEGGTSEPDLDEAGHTGALAAEAAAEKESQPENAPAEEETAAPEIAASAESETGFAKVVAQKAAAVAAAVRGWVQALLKRGADERDSGDGALTSAETMEEATAEILPAENRATAPTATEERQSKKKYKSAKSADEMALKPKAAEPAAQEPAAEKSDRNPFRQEKTTAEGIEDLEKSGTPDLTRDPKRRGTRELLKNALKRDTETAGQALGSSAEPAPQDTDKEPADTVPDQETEAYTAAAFTEVPSETEHPPKKTLRERLPVLEKAATLYQSAAQKARSVKEIKPLPEPSGKKTYKMTESERSRGPEELKPKQDEPELPAQTGEARPQEEKAPEPPEPAMQFPFAAVEPTSPEVLQKAEKKKSTSWESKEPESGSGETDNYWG